MFRGRFEHSFDEKGRIAIPSKFRELILDRSSEATIVVTNFDQCLAAYSLHQWEELERKISHLPQFDPTISSFLRYFVSGATECPLDKAGRILIPAPLRSIAGIDRDCVFIGQLTKFEIWSGARWASEFDKLATGFVGFGAKMTELGIQL